MSTVQTNRRQVRYASLAEVLQDAEQQAQRGAATIGNWSLGQIYQHLATTMDKSIDGFGFQAPWFVRIVGSLYMKGKILRDGMPSGFRLKGKAANVLVPPEAQVDEALAHLRAAIERLENEEQRSPHPALGAMDKDEWNRMHLRHAELHMSFIAEA